MPKNVKGGSKHKKMKNTSNNDEIKQEDLILKNGSDQDYGKVEKLLGNCRVSLLCNDKVIRMGIIRGSMRKRQWLNIGSIVIYAMRAYEVDKVDIIHVYNNNVLKILENRMNLNFNISEEEITDDIFTTDKKQAPITKKRLLEWSNIDNIPLGSETKKYYERNKTLIDLDEIPDRIYNNILNEYKSYKVNDRSQLLTYFIENKLKVMIENISDF